MDNIEWAIDILAAESKEGLYGSVSFNLHGGEITTVRIEKTKKPPLAQKRKT